MTLCHYFLLVVIVIIQTQYFLADAQNQRLSGNCYLNTRIGSVQGKIEQSLNGKFYCSFLGIPYAHQPKRFQEAEIKPYWNDTLEGMRSGISCPQWVESAGIYAGDENCLFLNIYYPVGGQCIGIGGALPVLVNIHGDTFETGSGTANGPKYIMHECVVFVSMNYRLGALGFLSTNDGLIPGNLGLKDIVLSLKWIQKNIGQFGGNSGSVTLLGYGSGASLVSLLIASPAAKGLFHRAIANSGSALNPVFVKKHPTNEARELAKRLKCGIVDTSSTADIRDCLLAANAKDIAANQHLYKFSKNPSVSFAAVVENANASNPFLRANPLYHLVVGDFNKVPLIMSFNEDEGASIKAIELLYHRKLVSDLNTRWEDIAPILLNYNEDYIPQEHKNNFSREIRSRYFGEKNINLTTIQGLFDLHADRDFVQGIFDTVELHSRYAPVYPYVFASKKGYCSICQLGLPYTVATQGSDMPLLFNMGKIPEVKEGTSSALFTNKYVKLLWTFARTGIPSETWPTKNVIQAYRSDGTNAYNWYKIDEEVSEVPNYLKGRRDFWRNLGLRRYDYPVFY